MRVCVQSREELTRDCLVAAIDRGKGLHVVCQNLSIRDGLQSAKHNHAAVIVVDCRNMEQKDIEFLNGAQCYGEFGVVAITEDAESPIDGAHCVSWHQPASELVGVILKAGERFDSLQVLPRGRGRSAEITGGYPLSRREYDVATLIAKGYTNQKIAETLQLKEQSVKNLVSTVIRKLKCENRVQVALNFRPD